MENLVSNTVTVLDDGNYVAVPSNQLYPVIIDENTGELTTDYQHIPITTSSGGMHDLTGSQTVILETDGEGNEGGYLPIETYQMMGTEENDQLSAPYYVVCEGDQVYEFASADKIQQLLMQGNEVILIQGAANDSGVITLPEEQEMWDFGYQSTQGHSERAPIMVDLLGNRMTQGAIDHSAPALQCPLCNIPFDNQRLYRKHMTNHEKDRPYKCTVCQSSYNHEVNLKIHVAGAHMDETVDVYSCPVCNKQFSRQAGFRGHLKWHQLDEDLTCGVCQELFKSRCLMDRHLEEHRNGTYTPTTTLRTPYSVRCKMCGMTLKSIGQLRQHYVSMHPKSKKTPVNADTGVDQNQEKESNDQPTSTNNSRVSKSSAAKFLKQILTKDEKPVQAETNDATVSKPKRSGRRKKGIKNISLDSNALSCSTCDKKFSKPSLLERHMVTHTRARPYKCNICGKGFSQKGTIKTHMVVHENEKPFNCRHCHRGFRHKCNLAHHIKVKHRGSGGGCRLTIKCPHCDSIFKRKELLSDHLLLSHWNVAAKSYVNQEVDASNMIITLDDSTSPPKYINVFPSFTQVNAESSEKGTSPSKEAGMNVELTDHETGKKQIHRVVEVDGVRMYVCICGKQWKKSVDLIRHMRCHTNERPFQCATCRKSFRFKSVWRMHLRSHSKTKTFKCDVCLKDFMYKQTLRVHMRLHDASAPHACERCGKRFNTTSHLKYHLNHFDHSKSVTPTSSKPATNPPEPLHWDAARKQMVPLSIPSNRTVHSDTMVPDRPYGCSQCGRSFKWKNHRDKHVRFHHLGERHHICKYCNQSFYGRSVLKKHVDCKHLRVRNYRCTLCRAAFSCEASRRRHMIVHSTARPFICPFCHKNFKTRMNCRRHTLIHLRDNPNLVALPTLEMSPEILASESVAEQQAVGSYNSRNDASLNQILSDYIGHPLTSSGQNVEIIECSMTDAYNRQTESMSLEHQETGTLENTYMNMAVSDEQPVHNFQVHGDGVSLLNPHEIGAANIDVNAFFSGTDHHMINTSEGQEIIGLETANMELDGRGDQENRMQFRVVPGNMAASIDRSQQPTAGHACPLLTQALLGVESVNLPYGSTASTKQGEIARQQIRLPVESSDVATFITTADLRDKPLFGCSTCSHTFMTPDDLVDHIKMSHSIEKKYICSTCNQSFVSGVMLSAHSQKHDPNASSEATCPVCMMAFPTHASLSRHVRMQHSSDLNMYCCAHCNTTYSNVRELSSHVKNILEDAEKVTADQVSPLTQLKKNRLDVQNKPKVLLTEHQANLLAEMKPTAKMSVSEKFLILAAKEKASEAAPGRIKKKSKAFPEGPTNHQCKYCSKNFKKHSDLQRHILSHTGERPFPCHICIRRFASNAALKNHLNSHSQVTSAFQCHLCESLCSTKHGLKMHMKLHTGGTPYACTQCSNSFRTPVERRRHEQNAHGIKVVKRATTTLASASTGEREQSLLLQLTEGHDEPTNIGTSDEPQYAILGDMSQLGSSQEISYILVDTEQHTQGEQQSDKPGSCDQIPVSLSGVMVEGTSKDTAVPSNVEYQVLLTQHTEMPAVVDPDSVPHTSGQTVSFNVAPSTVIGEAGEATLSIDDNTVNEATNNLMKCLWQCKKCEEAFSSNWKLRQHKCISPRKKSTQTQSEEGSSAQSDFLCETCGTSFTRKSDLERHSLRHTGKKPFKCNQCVSRFTQASSLQAHMKSHYVELVHPCPICPANFGQRAAMLKHVQSCHAESPNREEKEESLT